MDRNQFKVYNATHLCINAKNPHFFCFLRNEYCQLLNQQEAGPSKAHRRMTYIDGFGDSKKFICCENPRADSLENFYHMLWSNRNFLVVALQSEPENEENRYWSPEENGVLQAGRYQITTIKSKTFDNFVATELHLFNGVGLRRQVCHLSFSDWGENDIPRDVSKFFEFIKRVNHLQSKVKKAGEIKEISIGPIVVYCSKEYNQSGMFCAADNALYEMTKTAWMSLPRIVINIRRQLNSPVISLAQYLFCYRVVLYFLSTIDGIPTMTKNNTTK